MEHFALLVTDSEAEGIVITPEEMDEAMKRGLTIGQLVEEAVRLVHPDARDIEIRSRDSGEVAVRFESDMPRQITRESMN